MSTLMVTRGLKGIYGNELVFQIPRFLHAELVRRVKFFLPEIQEKFEVTLCEKCQKDDSLSFEVVGDFSLDTTFSVAEFLAKTLAIDYQVENENAWQMNVSTQLSKNHAEVVLKALDLYSRIEVGQLDSLLSGRILENRDECERLLRTIKKQMFPELMENASHGIFSKETPQRAKLAYDVYQVLRYTLAWHEHPEGGMTVDFHEPMQVSKTPLPVCSVIK